MPVRYTYPKFHELQMLRDLFKNVGFEMNLPEYVKKDLLRSIKYSRNIPVTGLGYFLAKESTTGEVLSAIAFQIKWIAKMSACQILINSILIKAKLGGGGMALNLISLLKSEAEKAGFYSLEFSGESGQMNKKKYRLIRQPFSANRLWDEYVFRFESQCKDSEQLKELVLTDEYADTLI